MSATATMNGKPPRKQLADQLDRLDAIIDALAEGLNGAVADAAREGTRLAVKDAIVEIMTNPELRAMLAPVRPEPPPAPAAPPVYDLPPEPRPVPGLWTRMKAKAVAARAAVVRAATKAKTKVADTCKAVRETVASVGETTGEVLPVRRVLWTAACVGLAVGVVCLVVPQTAAAAVSAVSVAVTAVAVQAGSWLKRAARRFGLVS